MIDTDVTEQRYAEAALRESEDRYRDLVEHSLDLICTHDLDGRLLTVNELPAKILGYFQEELVKKPMKEFLLKEGHASFDEYLKNIQTTKVAEGSMVVLTKDGERRIWEYHNSLRTDGVSVPVVRGIAHDVTERWLAEKALRQSEELLRAAFDQVAVGFSMTDLEARFLRVNEAYCRITGYTQEELLEMKFQSITHPDDLDRNLSYTQRLLSGEIRSTVYQKRYIRRTGEFVWVQNSASVLSEGNGKVCGLLALTEDITERKKAEEGIQELSGRLLQLQDDERRKIARDLHDQTGQNLVALSSTLGYLRTSIPPTSRKLRKSISECQELTDGCIGEVRTLSYVLHPPMLDEAGLEDAIQHYVSGFAERTGIHVKLEISPNFGRLAQEEETALFRVMQESLVNTRRHSGSASATIFLERTPQGVVLQIIDQGRGIQGNGKRYLEDAYFAGGVGIQSMRERMKQVRGKLEIESSPNGTTVRAVVGANDEK